MLPTMHLADSVLKCLPLKSHWEQVIRTIVLSQLEPRFIKPL